MLQCKVFSVHSLITSCDAAFVFSLMKWEHRYFVLYTAVCKGSVVGHSKLSYKNHWDLKVIYETLIKPASLFSWKTISLGFCNLVFLISLWSHCNRSAKSYWGKKEEIFVLSLSECYMFCVVQRCQSRLKPNCAWICKNMKWDHISVSNLNRRLHLGPFWGSWQNWGD